LKNLPRELTEAAQAVYYKRDNSAPTYSLQTEEEIMQIVSEAQNPPPALTTVAGFRWGTQEGSEGKKEAKQEEEEVEEDDEVEDDEDVYDKTVKQVHASGEFHLN
jgi:serine/threonine-protein kinase SRK2